MASSVGEATNYFETSLRTSEPEKWENTSAKVEEITPLPLPSSEKQITEFKIAPIYRYVNPDDKLQGNEKTPTEETMDPKDFNKFVKKTGMVGESFFGAKLIRPATNRACVLKEDCHNYPFTQEGAVWVLKADTGIDINEEDKTKAVCNAEVNHFLREYVNGRNVEEIAAELQKGGPKSVLIAQKMYKRITRFIEKSNQKPTAFSIAIQQIILPDPDSTEIAWKNKPSDFSDQEIHIFQAVEIFTRDHACPILKSPSGDYASKRAYTTRLIEFVDSHLKQWNEKLTLAQRTQLALDANIHGSNYSIESLSEALFIAEKDFNVSGLEMESYISDADNIADAAETLPVGAHLLAMPRYDDEGDLISGHTIGLIVEPECSYLYDPNIGLLWIPSDKRAEIVQRFLKIYSGYEAGSLVANPRKNPLEIRLAELEETRDASYPPEAEPSDTLLLKVNKSQQT